MNLNTCFYYWWDSITWENISAQIGKCEDKEVEKKRIPRKKAQLWECKGQTKLIMWLLRNKEND